MLSSTESMPLGFLCNLVGELNLSMLKIFIVFQIFVVVNPVSTDIVLAWNLWSHSGDYGILVAPLFT